jgi:para-aminobenzoate synthetase/4-amino-4-deoxychorismate lyase
MITDMIRNDLGRIARAGTVQVDALYDIEKYPTLWQMTSTVSATTDAGINQILTALFPCSSITGAPKKSAIGIIADLEDEPRGIYTGAIGWFGPGRQACFSVAIRTAVIDKDSGRATYGTGGGIVWDSEAHKEYDECLLKARVLGTTTDKRDYHLLETLRWDADDGYFLLGHHLERLKNSAEYFDFPFDCGTVEHALDAAIANVDLPHVRVRLLLARDGTVSASAAALDMRFETPAVRLAAAPVDPQDPFLYHKTTRRNVYDQALRGADGADDVLLWNPDGYITETAIANVIVRQRERMVTPPVSCGLLAGTYRRWLLENSDLVERPVHIDQLADGDEITLINSVRRAYTARLRLRPA